MNTNLAMRASSEDQQPFVKNSALYKEFMAEREEILKHKWIESEKAGADIGFEKALLDWIMKQPFELATKTLEGRPRSGAGYRLILVSSFKAILRGREGRHERKEDKFG
jgi:hypothetical protein